LGVRLIIKNVIFCLALGLNFIVIPSYADQFSKATNLYEQQKYKQAAELWEKAGASSSESGAAYYNLAELYRNGLGVGQHHGQAAYWYRLSAEKGYVPAMYELGLLHHRKGDSTVRNINAAILWWEKAALKGDVGSQMELAQLYFSPVYKDLLLALKFARAAANQNAPTSFLLLRKIDAQIRALAVRGASELSVIDDAYYTLAVASFSDFNSAWSFVIKNEIQNAGIHQSIYGEYDVTVGEFKNVDEAYAAIVSLRKDVLALRPRPRRMEVIHRELTPSIQSFDEAWVIQAANHKYTVELYRANSPIDAQGLINQHGLTNSAMYKSIYADTVVIAGIFESFEDADQVRQALPGELGLLEPQVVKFSDVQAQLMNAVIETPQIPSTLSLAPSVASDVAAIVKPASTPGPLNQNDQSFELFEKAYAWLFGADDSAYTLQVETINKRSDIKRVLRSVKRRYPDQSVHVFDQDVPEYYYFYVGLFNSFSLAREAMTELNAKGAVVRNIGNAKAKRCAKDSKKNVSKRDDLNYCSP